MVLRKEGPGHWYLQINFRLVFMPCCTSRYVYSSQIVSSSSSIWSLSVHIRRYEPFLEHIVGPNKAQEVILPPSGVIDVDHI